MGSAEFRDQVRSVQGARWVLGGIAGFSEMQVARRISREW